MRPFRNCPGTVKWPPKEWWPWLAAIPLVLIWYVDENGEELTENTRELTGKVEALTEMNRQLETRNQELRESLQLAEQQIQANRVVYQDLLEKVEASDTERGELRKQLENQRALLHDLRQKLAAP